MRMLSISPKSSGFVPLLGLASWLCGASTAWAGDGGESLGSLQAALNAVCAFVNLTPCPQLPTITQVVLEIAALENAPVEVVRSIGAAGPATSAGNPQLRSPPVLSNPIQTLQSLSPLAFIGNQAQTTPATPAQLYDATADTFLYAVTSGVSGQPDTLNLFYDNRSATSNSFEKGHSIAAMSLPLTVLNKNGTERLVMTTVQIIASCTGGAAACLTTATATGDFAGNGNAQTRNAADLGIKFAAVFGASAVSTKPHLIFGLQAPLLVTRATDPLYFSSANGQPYPLSPGIGTAFSSDDLGVKFSGSQIGIAPSAAPLCTAATCPPPPATPPAAIFPLCARLPTDEAGIVSAVAAFYAIAVDGEVLLSAPNPPTSPIKCSAFPF